MFDAAARHLNFGLAAEELNLTQGAVAQQVRKLEQELDVKLFHRLARGLALTEAGKNYSGAVRKAMKIIEQATQKLQVPSKKLRLSVPPSLASKWLVPRLKSFNQTYPEIKVEIVASETLADFETDEVDLAIRMGQPPFTMGLIAQPLAAQMLCAICNPDFATRVGKINEVEDLINCELIHDHHSQWSDFITDLPNTVGGMKFNQTALAMDAALNGQGVALVPYLLAQGEIANGRLVELWRNKKPSRTGYYIIRSEMRKVQPNQQTMIDWLLMQAGN
ncbi:MAG: hypothetical protein COB24_01665 [Hyphomicrobiales bacterium]|nr:MAG: hypothetical protein COB24_01665 [Hyphomicrobiales bacterium]